MTATLSVRSRSLLLLAGAGVCLLITAAVAYRLGPTVYFLTFHKPLSWSQPVVKYAGQTLPTVILKPSIGRTSLKAGETQTMAVTLQASSPISGFLEIWVMSPDHKQTYQNPIDEHKPQLFSADTPYAYTFTYVVPTTAAKGTYLVSTNVVSANKQIDYAIKRNFATFEVL